MRLAAVAPLRGVRLAAAVLAAASAAGCSEYYSRYRYFPVREVHELRREGQGGAADAVVSVEMLGVRKDEGHARLHTHFSLENSTAEPLTFPMAGVEAIPGGVQVLHPENQIESIEVGPGEHRHVEVYFPLPEDPRLPKSALAEIELHWQIRIGDRVHDSRATFRGERVYPSYYYYDYYYPWGYYGPWYYPYHYPYYPHFGFHGHFYYRHCY